MSIGLITSPTTPIPIGTVASPTWATTVEDDINGLLNGTGPTLKALQIDGVGGQSASPSAAQLVVGQSVAADTALILLNDPAGNRRTVFDHLGYPMTTNVFEMREDWIGTAQTVSASTSPLANFPRWSVTVASTGNQVIVGSAPNAFYSFNGAAITLGNTNTSSLTLFPGAGTFPWFQNYQSAVFEAEVFFPAAFTGVYTVMFGLNGTGLSSTNAAAIYATNSTANWQCLTTNNSGTNTAVDSGVTAGIASASVVQYRIELHGSATSYGTTTARFFIGGSLVATINAGNLPTTGHNLNPTFYVLSGDTTASRQMTVGAFRYNVNRALSSPTI